MAKAIIDEEEEEEAGRKKVSREKEISIKGLPDGVRAMLRSTPWRDKDYDARIYRMLPDPMRRGRWSPKYITTEPNAEMGPEALQQMFPAGGKFQVMYTIKGEDAKGDINLYTDTFDIDAAPNFGGSPYPAAPVNGAAPPAPAQAGAGSLTESVNLLQSLAQVLVTMQGGGRDPSAPAPLALAVSEQFYKDRVTKLDAKEKELDSLKLKLEAQIAKSNNGLPDAMKPFSPLIEALSAKIAQGIAGGGAGANGAAPSPMLGMFTPMLKGAAQKLIGDGEEAKILRGMVFNAPDFQSIWGDVSKRAGVAGYIVNLFPDIGPDLVKDFMAMTPNPTT